MFFDFFSLTHVLAVPKKVEDAIKKFRYIDYSLLVRASREGATRDDETLSVSDGRVELTAKAMKPSDETELGQFEWLAAAQTVEKKTLEHLGAERADALRAHHENILSLSNTYDWKVACAYDRRTRELVANDPRHDLVVINQNLVIQANSNVAAAKANASALALHASVSRMTPSFQPSPSSLGPVRSSTPARRFSPFDQSGRQSRTPRTQGKCFRCGAVGHMSATCDSKVTPAGFPCALWAKRPGTKSGSLIDGPSGQPFCFSWTQSSFCRFGNHVHKCSICSDIQHGANVCPK